MDYKKKIAELINIEGVSADEIFGMLAFPKDLSMGDYCLPCFKFAGKLRKAPVMIANELKDGIDLSKNTWLEKVESVAGYLNFTLNKSDYADKIIGKILSDGENYGKSDMGKGKTVCIDYSSVNIAKPFHIGHLSTTVIGAALYRIYKALGYEVVGINHLGDWGTQFGKLISAFKRWGNKEDIEKRGIKALFEIYVRFHSEEKENPALADEGRAWFKKIEDGDKEATELFSFFREVTLKEVEKLYERLGVKFDSYCGESFYNDKMQPVLDELEQKGLLTESEGAKVVNLDSYDMPPCLLVKADGATLYATRDMAAAFYRKQTYDFDKCLYVVAYQQNLHFKQWFKVVELMEKEWYKDLVHVAFGMVSLEDGAMSTREGRVVFLEEVLDKAVKKAGDIINEKNPNLKDKEKISEQVGVGAVVFSALCNNRIKDIVFNFDKVLNFDGETAPYLQYTTARCNSVIEKAGESDLVPDYSGVTSAVGAELINVLSRFSQVVKDSAEKYEPSFVTRYLLNVAGLYNKFYFEHKIITDDKNIQQARLNLTKATRTVLKNGLALLGIQAPERM
ncbi:MAG: arginine--tRNA ligase [Clostridia bacterium]|nr:arginine--tRNA ligase [Clostridia bacterium]